MKFVSKTSPPLTVLSFTIPSPVRTSAVCQHLTLATLVDPMHHVVQSPSADCGMATDMTGGREYSYSHLAHPKYRETLRTHNFATLKLVQTGRCQTLHNVLLRCLSFAGLLLCLFYWVWLIWCHVRHGVFPWEMHCYSKWSHHTIQSVAVAISHRLEITNEIDHRQTRRQKLTVHA